MNITYIYSVITFMYSTNVPRNSLLHSAHLKVFIISATTLCMLYIHILYKYKLALLSTCLAVISFK